MRGEPILRMVGVSKTFGAVKALENVDFEVYAGEVIALVGDNGAGKSTLIKIISGAYTPTDGKIYWCGKRVESLNPMKVRNMHIETIYQDLALVEKFTIAENIFLGRELTFPHSYCVRFLNFRKMRNEADKILKELKINIETSNYWIEHLSGGQRQSVAVSKAVYWKAQLVIMDEPTAALGVRETKEVLNLIRRLRDNGTSVIFISHNIQQVFEVADRIIVLRNGRRVGESNSNEVDPSYIVALMTGALEVNSQMPHLHGTAPQDQAMA